MSSKTASRPKKGLPSDEALAKWARLLLEQGLEGVRMADISAVKNPHTACPKADPYFQDAEGKPLSAKKRVVRALLARGWEIIGTELHFTEKTEDPVERLDAIVTRFLQIYQTSHPTRRDIFLYLIAYFRDPGASHRPQDLAEFNRQFNGLFEMGQAKGIFRQEIRPALFREAVFGAFSEMLYFHYLAKKYPAAVMKRKMSSVPYTEDDIQDGMAMVVRGFTESSYSS